jgi:hypothetical protein
MLAAVFQVAAVSQHGGEYRLALLDIEGFAEGLDRRPHEN